MARGILVGGLIGLLVLAGVSTLAYVLERGQGSQRAPGAMAVTRGSPPVAFLNGEPVTRSDLLEQQALMASMKGSAPPSRKEAFEALVRDLLLAREARRRGLALDASTAAALAASHRHLFEQKRLPDQEYVEELIASLGIPADWFWSSVAPRLYERSFSVAALRRQEGERMDRLYRRLRDQASLQLVDQAFLQGR